MKESKRMAFNKDELLKVKEKWLEVGFIGGAIICDFFLMKDAGLDIVFDSSDKLVKEYYGLLQRRLEAKSYNLVLMVNTELEKCILNQEEIYNYLCDEIYEHFKNNGKVYPVQAVGLHIDVITALIYLDERETVYNYLYVIKETYKEILGEKSYLFCRNWGYILNEVFLKFFPKIAIKEFEDNVELFSQILREDIILYLLCINIGRKRAEVKREANPIKESIDLCKIWIKGIPEGKQKEIKELIDYWYAFYCEYIGDYNIALEIFGKKRNIYDNIHIKLFILVQIAMILYIKSDREELKKFFESYAAFFETLSEPEESVAELYNLKGLYYMQTGNYYEAEEQIEKAIDISKKLEGEETDNTIKYKSNKLLIKFKMGEFSEANIQLKKLFKIISENPQQYPVSMPNICNNLLYMSFKEGIGSAILRMNTILDKGIGYNIISNIVFKCNLYFAIIVSGDNYVENDINSLRVQLQKYFDEYPNSEGYIVYLRAEACRLFQEKNVIEGYEVLEKSIECLEQKGFGIEIGEDIYYFIAKLKVLIYKKEYFIAKKYLLSLWEYNLVPLFESLVYRGKEDANYIFILLNTYISIFISASKYYEFLKITDKELYEVVLNFKYFEDLFYTDKNKFCIKLKRKKWISISNIKMSKERFILECFNYSKYNMEDIELLFAGTDNDRASSMYQICFGLQFSVFYRNKYRIDVISDVPFMELEENIYSIYETEGISQIERITWNKLKKFVYNKDKIYVCNHTLTFCLPLASMRINEEIYWGECYEIIYCNNAIDVKDDIEIEDISNSLYWGVSFFDENGEKGDKVQKAFFDLPYVELEVDKLGRLTGGEAYSDKKAITDWFESQQKEIIHFATHAEEDKQDGEKALIIEAQKDGKYILLKSGDIANLNWEKVKLVVFSACETDIEAWKSSGYNSLAQAARQAGASFCISTVLEVYDGANSFFMICLYKNFIKYKRIIRAFFETQKSMRVITKREILADPDYLDIYMDYYLQHFGEDDKPFAQVDMWAMYVLHMN